MADVVQALRQAARMPSQEVLALHHRHESFDQFALFQARLPGLLLQGERLEDVLAVTRALGILEPFTGMHIAPENIQIQGPNYRESMIANRLPSRHRAVLVVLEHLYGSLRQLGQMDVYLAEALTGFADWMQQQLGSQRLSVSEYQLNAELNLAEIPHQDLCALSFPNGRFDLVLCNELFEHVQDLQMALREIARVLKPQGRLVATCPMAFGQYETIVKALHNPVSGRADLLTEPERHGDPVRPESGSLVYRIPGWQILDELRQAGFSQAHIHHIASWKHGVLGSDLPGVLVIDAAR